MGARVITADTPAEVAAIGHLRGWCHDGSVCPICKAAYAQHAAELRLDSVITGTPLPAWAAEV